MLDPTTTFGGSSLDVACYVTNPAPGTPSDPKLCSSNTGTDNNVVWGYTAYQRHAYLNFGDLTATGSPVPVDAVVQDATLTLTESAQSAATAMSTDLYAPTAAWTAAGITWANQPAVSPTLYERETITPPGIGNPFTLHPTRLVAGWVNGSIANNGMQLRLTADTSPLNTLQSYGFANASAPPTLTVYWTHNLGQQSLDRRLRPPAVRPDGSARGPGRPGPGRQRHRRTTRRTGPGPDRAPHLQLADLRQRRDRHVRDRLDRVRRRRRHPDAVPGLGSVQPTRRRPRRVPTKFPSTTSGWTTHPA